MEAWAVKLGVAEARGERLTALLRELGCFLLQCQISSSRNNLVVQWLAVCASTVRVTGSILSRGAMIPHAM